MSFTGKGLPPVEPSADMRQAALELRGMFLAYVGSGFTEKQALSLLGVMLANAANNAFNETSEDD